LVGLKLHIQIEVELSTILVLIK